MRPGRGRACPAGAPAPIAPLNVKGGAPSGIGPRLNSVGSVGWHTQANILHQSGDRYNFRGCGRFKGINAGGGGSLRRSEFQ